MRFLPPALAAAALLAFGTFLASELSHRSSAPSPTHVVAEFVDGFNHGDFRQMCAVSKIPAGATVAQCEQFYAGSAVQGSFFGVWGGYRVIAHSYKGWREGSTSVASVKFEYAPHGKPAGQVLTARLVKTAHGWRIVSVR